MGTDCFPGGVQKNPAFRSIDRGFHPGRRGPAEAMSQAELEKKLTLFPNRGKRPLGTNGPQSNKAGSRIAFPRCLARGGKIEKGWDGSKGGRFAFARSKNGGGDGRWLSAKAPPAGGCAGSACRAGLGVPVTITRGEAWKGRHGRCSCGIEESRIQRGFGTIVDLFQRVDWPKLGDTDSPRWCWRQTQGFFMRVVRGRRLAACCSESARGRCDMEGLSALPEHAHEPVASGGAGPAGQHHDVIVMGGTISDRWPQSGLGNRTKKQPRRAHPRQKRLAPANPPQY